MDPTAPTTVAVSTAIPRMEVSRARSGCPSYSRQNRAWVFARSLLTAGSMQKLSRKRAVVPQPRILGCVAGHEHGTGEFCSRPAGSISGSRTIAAPWATERKRGPSAVAFRLSVQSRSCQALLGELLSMWFLAGVRAGARAYLGPRPRVGSRDRPHDGDGVWFPLGEVRCGRSVFGGRPRGRGGSGMPGAGPGVSA